MQKSFFVSFVIVTLMVTTIKLFHFSALLPHLSFFFFSPLNGNVHVHQENVFEEEIMNKEYSMQCASFVCCLKACM